MVKPQVDKEFFWQCVEKYNSVMAQNAKDRVSYMSERDRQAFARVRNTKNDTPEVILDYLMRTGGFEHLVLQGGLCNRRSDLFDRLLDNKDPLPYPPPRTFGRPWYQLIENGRSENVEVDGFALSVRKRDLPDLKYVIHVNKSPWEVVSCTTDLHDMLVLDQAIKAGTYGCEAVEPVLFTNPFSMVLTFGQCPHRFELIPEPVETEESCASTSLFRCVRWQIQRVEPIDT